MPAKSAEPDLEGTTTGSMSRLMLYRIGIIATRRGLMKAEALDKYAGPAIEREFNRCVEELTRDLGEAGA